MKKALKDRKIQDIESLFYDNAKKVDEITAQLLKRFLEKKYYLRIPRKRFDVGKDRINVTNQGAIK